jgi:hypothetical protein
MKCVFPLGLILLFFNLSVEAQNFTTTNAQKLIQSGDDSLLMGSNTRKTVYSGYYLYPGLIHPGFRLIFGNQKMTL